MGIAVRVALQIYSKKNIQMSQRNASNSAILQGRYLRKNALIIAPSTHIYMKIISANTNAQIVFGEIITQKNVKSAQASANYANLLNIAWNVAKACFYEKINAWLIVPLEYINWQSKANA